MEGKRIKPLSRAQVDLLKKSFRQLNGEELGSRFYRHLFTQYPDLRKLFSADMAEQIAKIISVLELVVFSFEEREADKFWIQNTVVIPLRELGKKHTSAGVIDAHYPIANGLLIQSVKEEMGEAFTAAHEDAWKLALAHLTSSMLNKNLEDGEVNEKSTTLKDSFNYIRRLLIKSRKE